jgi:hypothetical protein
MNSKIIFFSELELTKKVSTILQKVFVPIWAGMYNEGG